MSTRNVALGILLAFGCSAKAPTPAPPPPPPGGSDDPSANCTGPAPSPEHKCVQDCGPPVAREGDPPPGWSWLSPDEVKQREVGGCPRCLPPDTRIATPDGERPISSITPGMRVFTIDAAGNHTIAEVVRVGSAPVRGHTVIRVTLADGRVVAGSDGHPAERGTLGDLRAGDLLDRSVVVRAERVPFTGERTWDILPSGPTGLYVANGVVLRSTLFQQPR